MCLLYPALNAAFNRFFNGRGDGSPIMQYLSAEDCGISSVPFSFMSGKWRLQGERYFAGPEPYKGLVIFFHGVGAGRSSYTLEISALAKAGYLVLAYDNTGCMQSEGKGMNGLPQAVLDQEAFFHYLETQEDIRDLPRFAMGHSWGGYLALMASRPEYHVQKVVSGAGFFELGHLVSSSIPKLSFLEKSIKRYVKHKYGRAASRSALDYVKESGIPVLYLQGKHDKIVTYEGHYEYLKKHKEEYPNIRILCFEHRAHQVFWTDEAQAYFEELFGNFNEKKTPLTTLLNIDYDRLNVDDPILMQVILDFFEE